MDENISNILGEYDRQSDLYKDFAVRCESLVKELLGAEGQRVHSVAARLKRRDKREWKLQREGKSYKTLSEVTDVAGVRIITHFEDDVDRIGTLIETEFGTDPKRSIDKRKALDPDRFGYLSLHYICGLNANRIKLPENRRYAGLWCEIQIRSILQHAWAEIEHDLGYKPDNTVPAPIRRRFSRLAGLLEIADQEFKSIRDELNSYAARVEDEIKSEPSQVEIDDLSLAAFIRNDELCRELDAQMARETGLRQDPESLDPQKLADYLRHSGLVTMSELRNELELNRDLLRCQLARRISQHPPRTDNLNRGISLLQLAEVRIAKAGLSSLLDFFTKFGFRDANETVPESAQRLISAVEECSKPRR